MYILYSTRYRAQVPTYVYTQSRAMMASSPSPSLLSLFLFFPSFLSLPSPPLPTPSLPFPSSPKTQIRSDQIRSGARPARPFVRSFIRFIRPKRRECNYKNIYIELLLLYILSLLLLLYSTLLYASLLYFYSTWAAEFYAYV